jgi:alpha-tubulin suppressor-like RCC1 family protein
MAAGLEFSLVLDGQGKVWACGWTAHGRLGIGSNLPYDHYNAPQLVKELKEYAIMAIAAGYAHSLALDDQGRMWAWGWNGHGQLGLGPEDTHDYWTPTEITGAFRDAQITAIAAGGYHSLAADHDGNVWTWGYNNEGQLGNDTNDSSATPTQINLNATVVQVAAHGGTQGRHSLARDDQGRVWAWGHGWYGQLGDRTQAGGTNRKVPYQVKNIGRTHKITDIAAGAYHSMAREANGNLWTWGWNARGQLGTSAAPNVVREPETIQNFTNIQSIAAGEWHSLAVSGPEPQPLK